MALTRITAQQISDSDFKQSVRAVNTTNTNLTGGAPSTVDGVSLVAKDRILVVGQSTASQNGLYNVATVGTGSNGTWTRTPDGDATGEISSGMIVVATEGTAYSDSEWLLTTNDPIVIGSTALAFIQLNATIYSGTSNVAVVNSGNVAISSAGVANVAVISADGVYVNSNLYVSTNTVITGNLTVNGTTTTINSNTITTNDKTITVANNQSTSANVDGAGFDAGGGTPIATWRYNNATTSWQSNVGITPESNATISLGGASNYWGTVYVTTASVTGNITGGNVTTAGLISAAGNVTSSYFIGNGSQLTGLPATYGNANVVANLASLGTNPVSTTGNVTAGYFIGNASQLTGLPAIYGNANVAANLASFGSNPISTTGNVTSSYFFGNGSQLTGMPAIYGNANVAANLAAFGSNPVSTTGNITSGNMLTGGLISATGNVTGNYIIGNGSQLTGAVANATYAASAGSAGTAGTVTTAAQPNITSVGILSSVSVTGNVTGTNLYGTLQTAAQLNVTSLGALSTLTVSGNASVGNLTTGGTISAVGNISTSADMRALNFNSAAADLAENYTADAEYVPGTVLDFGGSQEVTLSTLPGSTRIAGVVSTQPGHLMNSMLESDHIAPVALQGRVPTLVIGTVRKGDMMVSAGNGYAQASAAPAIGSVIGKAIENFDGVSGTIEVVIGRL